MFYRWMRAYDSVCLDAANICVLRMRRMQYVFVYMYVCLCSRYVCLRSHSEYITMKDATAINVSILVVESFFHSYSLKHFALYKIVRCQDCEIRRHQHFPDKHHFVRFLKRESIEKFQGGFLKKTENSSFYKALHFKRAKGSEDINLQFLNEDGKEGR